MKQPPQPLVNGRFQKNAIVDFLLEFAKGHGVYMNELAIMDFSDEDRQQFAQLIGYSLQGWGDLSYVTDDAWNRATEQEQTK